jgi:hypothetical protein
VGGSGRGLFHFAGKPLNTLANVGQFSQERASVWMSAIECFVYTDLLGNKKADELS